MLVSSATALGQSGIKVTVRSAYDTSGTEHQLMLLPDPVDPNTPIVLDTEQMVDLAEADAVFVRIYDTSTETGGAPTRSIPRVVVQVVNGVRPYEVRVLVASPYLQDDYNLQPNNRIEYAGAINFRGLTVDEPAPGFGEILVRDFTRVAVAVTGNVGTSGQGDSINVGQVYRLQADGSLDGSGNIIGGNIHADVIATYTDVTQYFTGQFQFFNPIPYVTAGNSITGDIIATGYELSPGNYLSGSIDRVQVAPFANAAGITGDIKAEHGKITAIYSAGPIGTALQKSQIRAGDGIRELRSYLETTDQVLDRDIHADIRADLNYQLFPCTDPGCISPYNDGAIQLIQTNGDLVGSVKAANVTYFTNAHSHAGILVKGVIDAPIDIDLNLENADIIAGSILQPINIGVKAKGAIVATDPSGYIDSVTIGRSSNADPSVISVYTAFFPRAYVGNDCPPFNPIIAGTNTPNTDLWYDLTGSQCPLPGGADRGTFDSVIKAHTIGNIDIAQMSPIYLFTSTADLCKSYAPRIEAGHIDQLTIDDMQTGVVWSGNLEYASNGAVDNNYANDYASISSVKIGFLSPTADIWAKGCEEADFTGDVFGEIYLPYLHDNERIRIGGKFTAATGHPCLCNSAICEYYVSSLVEDSPRAPGMADVARIVLPEADSLEGQIILDAANPTDLHRFDYWAANILVGAGDPNNPGTPRVFSPFTASATSGALAPFYTLAASNFGGGAIGLTPFRLARQDCEPLSSCTGLYCNNLPIVPQSTFVGGDGIKLRFYGPIDVTTGSSIHMHPCDVWGAPITSTDYASQLTLTLDGRTMSVNGPSLPSGRYALVHSDAADLGLVSTELFNDEEPVVPSFVYRFVLIAGATGDADCSDFNGDGDNGTDADIEAFFACLAGSCCPTCFSLGTDFDCNGDAGTDADIEAFFAALAGTCPQGCIE